MEIERQVDENDVSRGPATADEIDWRDIYRRLVVYFASSFGMTATDAEDASQTVIERLLRSEPRRDRSRPFLPWCYRFARNYGIDLHRRMSREPRSMPIAESAPPAGPRSYEPEHVLTADEIEGEVSRCVEELDASDREVAFLRFYERLGYREIARVTGRPSGTIRYRVHRIRRRLAERLQRAGAIEDATDLRSGRGRSDTGPAEAGGPEDDGR